MELIEFIFFVFFTFFLFAIVRVVMLRISMPLPQNYIVCLLGVLMAYFSHFFDHMNVMAIVSIDPRIAVDMILPITMFMAGYYVNAEVFQRPGLQILLFLTVYFVVTIGVMTVLVSFLCGWPFFDSTLMICSVLPPGPILARTFLKRLTVSHKLEMFMVGEALLSNVMAYLLFTNLGAFGANKRIHSEELLHTLFFSFFLGYAGAKIVSYWISRIIKDMVNTVCIIFTSVYFVFLLAELALVNPVLTIVVMAIYMSGQQSCMDEQSEEVLFRILNVFANFFQCNLFVVIGIDIYLYREYYDTFMDIVNIILIFGLMAGIRAAVVGVLSGTLHNTGFCLSANNLLVLCTCHIRGSLSILMCHFMVLDGFPLSEPNKVFTYCISQICLSQLLNTVVSNLVIRYDILAKYDESRENFISTIMDILDSIRYRSLSANRHGNLSFADADWHTVSKYTELKHPLITLPVSVTSNQAAATISSEQEEARSIRRILTIAKCSYRKQYQEGLMSRNALKLLTQWTSHALAKGENLIFPSKIASVLTIPNYYVFLLKNFGQRYRHLTCRDNSCDLLRVAFVLFHFVDFVFTVLAMANVVVADYASRDYFFLLYNLSFVCTHLIWLLAISFIKKKMDLWDVMIIPIVVIGVVDISVLQVVTGSSAVSRVLRATCVLSRSLRPVRLAGLFLITLKPLMFACDRLVSHRLMDGYDIGRSYIQARLEVVRLLSHVEDVPLHLCSSYKISLKQHKIEAVKMLGIMQMHCPSTLTTAKTRQATRIVLKRQEYIVKNIQQSRALGEDGAILEKIILTKLTSMNTTQIKISHPDYTDIIMNVPWIKDMNDVYLKIMEKGSQMNFQKYETIVSQYENPRGIFIILEGIALVQREGTNRASQPTGSNITVDYLSSGSVIGEYTFLTGKPRHKTIGCYTDVMGMFIKSQVLHELMGGVPNTNRAVLFKLEEKMWRVVALRIALRFLMGEPAWLPWSQSQIMMRLVDSVLVDGSNSEKTFNEWVAEYEIVLVQGKIIDLSSHELLSAPAYIPRQRTTYAFMLENKRRPLMLAIPSVEEFDLYVSTHDHPRDIIHQLKQSESQCTFSSGSSNNPPSWQPRMVQLRPRLSSTGPPASDETEFPSTRWELSFGRRALKSMSYPFAILLGRGPESPVTSKRNTRASFAK